MLKKQVRSWLLCCSINGISQSCTTGKTRGLWDVNRYIKSTRRFSTRSALKEALMRAQGSTGAYGPGGFGGLCCPSVSAKAGGVPPRRSAHALPNHTRSGLCTPRPLWIALLRHLIGRGFGVLKRQCLGPSSAPHPLHRDTVSASVYLFNAPSTWGWGPWSGLPRTLSLALPSEQRPRAWRVPGTGRYPAQASG